MAASKFQALWNHPVGPKTSEFSLSKSTLCCFITTLLFPGFLVDQTWDLFDIVRIHIQSCLIPMKGLLVSLPWAESENLDSVEKFVFGDLGLKGFLCKSKQLNRLYFCIIFSCQ